MKIRCDFVTNSSSSSFLFTVSKPATLEEVMRSAGFRGYFTNVPNDVEAIRNTAIALIRDHHAKGPPYSLEKFVAELCEKTGIKTYADSHISVESLGGVYDACLEILNHPENIYTVINPEYDSGINLRDGEW